jgi:hypothetical protein
VNTPDNSGHGAGGDQSMIDDIVKSNFRRSLIGVDLEDKGDSEFNTIEDRAEHPAMWILDDKAGETVA